MTLCRHSEISVNPALLLIISRSGRFMIILALLLIVLGSAADLSAQGLAVPGDRELRCGYSMNVLTEFEVADAKLAMTIWSKEMAKNMDVITEFYDTPADVLAQIKAKKLDMVILTGLDYLREPEARLLEPAMVGVVSKKAIMTELLLITNKNTNISSVKQMRGKRLFFYAGVGGEGMGLLWLDTMLLREGFPTSAEFFQLAKVDNVSKAVLPVFFQQAEAAVVPRQAYDSMVELNPQIGKDVVILKSSPQLLATAAFFRKDYDDQKKKEVLEVARTRRGSPTGRQMLTLFRVTDIVPLTEQDVDSLRTLLAEYKRLRPKTAMR